MLKYLLEKEFKQIFRNAFLPKLIIVLPVVMLLVTPWAANMEVKNSQLTVVDADKSTSSERLIQKIVSSGHFKLYAMSGSYQEALSLVESGQADVILEIPLEFEKNLVNSLPVEVMISANAVNGTKAGVGSSYLASIIAGFSEEMRTEWGIGLVKEIVPVIQVFPYNKFNKYLSYQAFMVPALIVLLLTLLSGFLPAFNIVGEKENGTIEQMNVSPVGRLTFIFSKLIPYWIIGFIVLTIGMIIAALVYGLFPAGNILLIYFYAAIYILVVSGMGLIISNYSETMQQAMFLMFFFVLILVLLSGLFTPIRSMPPWAQVITAFNPLTYFMQVMRGIYLKGSGLVDLLPQLFILIGFAFVLNLWAVFSYAKRK